MPPISQTPEELATRFRDEVAGATSLTAAQARLYSHAIRLTWGVAGLPNWTEADAQAQFDDAIRLIEAASILKGADGTADVSSCYRRAGDLLEWLDRVNQPAPSTLGKTAPLSLLAAACFQLAALPAMASGILNRPRTYPGQGPLFAEFLKANFREVQAWVTKYWRSHPEWTRPAAAAESSDSQYAIEMVRSIGLVAMAIERDEPSRLEVALKKLRALAKFAARSADAHTWLTLSLTADVADRYAMTSVWRGVDPLRAGLNAEGTYLLNAFVRNLFRERRGLLWPSQFDGVARLATGRSFAMCTPTGSGKTTVAELALVQTLHQEARAGFPPLVIYIVPSRALAAEAEARFQQDFGLIAPSLTVTSLYGGADWSLADAWLSAEGPTVLITTVEMAESLLRYVGPLLVPRVRLAIIDEAHQVQFSSSADSLVSLIRAEDRSARLESFAARLFTNAPQCRAIALSAVAGGTEDSIAHWFSGTDSSAAVGTNYRSTRQLIGVLECRPDGSAIIRLEMMNGVPLRVAGRSTEAYIPRPITPMPRVTGRFRQDMGCFVRAHVLWAAVNLAHAGRSVLVSVTSHLNTTLGQFRNLLTEQAGWRGQVPAFFAAPNRPDQRRIYDACLAAAEDYCGADSHEVFFLRLGIAVHHGQLPVRVRRLMTETIRAGITPVTVATSTLTEGVNLPFDIILLPSIIRPQFETDPPQWETLTAGEFLNLTGRAGRPGTGVEGMTLVALAAEGLSKQRTRARREQEDRVLRDSTRFEALLRGVQLGAAAGQSRSPIAALLNAIWKLWCDVTGQLSQDEFLRWLETATPADSQSPEPITQSTQRDLTEALDALDFILLAAVEEAERLRHATLPPSELEEHMRRLWGRTFARYAAANVAWLERIFVTRGVSVPTRIYPDPARRRVLYQMGFPPGYAAGFEPIAAQIEAVLRRTDGFADWSPEERYQLFERIGLILDGSPRFRFQRLPAGTNWQAILRWWLQGPQRTNPAAKDVRDWLLIGTSEFEIRLGIAISSTLSLIWNRVRPDVDALPDLETWHMVTGLPWAAFWLRELLAWGTLEPVTAYIIASGRTASRAAAAPYAGQYEEWWRVSVRAMRTEFYDPRSVRRWYDSVFPPEERGRRRDPTVIPVRLLRNPTPATPDRITVFPSSEAEQTNWFDGAGYLLATNDSTEGEIGPHPDNDFSLFPRESVVRVIN